MSWVIVHVFPNCERRVLKELSRLDAETYLPLIRVWRRSRFKRRAILREIPAFPGYLFVRRGSRLPEIEDGRFMVVDGRLCEISDDQASALISRGFIVDESNHYKRRLFRRGAHVRMQHAMFGNCAGTIIHCGAIYAELSLDVNAMKLLVPVVQLEEAPINQAS